MYAVFRGRGNNYAPRLLAYKHTVFIWFAHTYTWCVGMREIIALLGLIGYAASALYLSAASSFTTIVLCCIAMIVCAYPAGVFIAYIVRGRGALLFDTKWFIRTIIIALYGVSASLALYVWGIHIPWRLLAYFTTGTAIAVSAMTCMRTTKHP